MAQALGRGLGSLIPQKVNKIPSAPDETVIEVTSEEDKGRIVLVDPKTIQANPMQPRHRFAEADLDDLADSIRTHGIIQPLIVTLKNGQYELIAGERRLRASQIAGLRTVPVIIREANEQQKLELALIENIQRAELNPIETAIAYRKLIDEFNLTQDEMALKVGKSRPVVSNALRLLNLPEEIQLALIDGRISEGHAKLLAGTEGEAKQMTLFRRIVHGNLSVADTMRESRHMGGTKHARIKINYGDKDKEFALREFFGSKVEVKRSGKGGQVVISFYSDEELDEMIGKIKRN